MKAATERDWLFFDVHGVGVHLDAATPAAGQLRTLLGGFAADHKVPGDLVITGEVERMVEPSVLDRGMAYTASAVHFRRQHIQIVRCGSGYRVNGAGHLVTAVLPVLDLLTASRGVSMIHAATVADRGRAFALCLPGEPLMASTIDRFARRPGSTVMATAWSLVTSDGHSLGLLSRSPTTGPRPQTHGRLPLPDNFVASSATRTFLGRPLDRLIAAVHPEARSPEQRAALNRCDPRLRARTQAPLRAVVVVERYDGAQTRTAGQSIEWMVQRLVGTAHLALPGLSQHLLAGMAATSHLSLASFFDDKARVCRAALAAVPGVVVRVPSVYSPAIASDEIVRTVADVLTSLEDGARRPSAALRQGPAS